MAVLDWVVLIATLAGIITYGLYKSRHEKTLEGYFLSSRSMPWWLVLLSIMGTQASAVTFLSAPGQAYTDGMRFVQYYFGLPIAMIVISAFFVPIFHKLKVYTAYEFLEQRFDLKTRTLTSFLFLLGRGLSTGISIYAPAIIVSSLLGWNIYLTNLVMGGLLIIYTVSGGAKSIAYTQQLQFLLEFGERIGAAFQLADDIIDIASDADDSGKVPGTDLREGVPTLPTMLVQRHRTAGDDRLIELLAGPIASEEDVQWTIAALREHPAMERARDYVRAEADAARALLDKLPAGSARDALDELCTRATERIG